MPRRVPDWTVYILRCADDTYYTGITNDLPRRLGAHNNGTGAKYTRGRAPVILCHMERKRTKGNALKRELAIKKMTRAEKERLIKKD